MRSTSWQTVAAVATALAVPLVFVSILVIWKWWDELLSHDEVSLYIRRHQSLVMRRLRNPKVHSFSLTHHPSVTGTLLVQFDVDDKSTWELLRSDYGYAGFVFRALGEVWSVFFTMTRQWARNQWEKRLSGEEL
jgi:hypothetical protein